MPIVSVNHSADLGEGFADIVRRALVSDGLQLDSIGTADLHIVILSKSFSNSSECLTQLLNMWKSGKPIIPILYDIRSSDLYCYTKYCPVLRTFRWVAVNNESPYNEDLRRLEEGKMLDPHTVTEWRKGLTDLAGICAFNLKCYNR